MLIEAKGKVRSGSKPQQQCKGEGRRIKGKGKINREKKSQGKVCLKKKYQV